ncbi:MAG: hypothetical protein KDB14_24925, partial [Planctomycetales bacterium]|nr:hypothetical protein [Planctomycetales bacterium]
MNRLFRSRLLMLGALVWLGAVAGCRTVKEPPAQAVDYRPFVQQIEYPDASTPAPLYQPDAFAAPPTLSNFENLESWQLSLDE